jgi:hypothetical protein
MPIHFNDLDVASEVAGLSSALIVPCNMCPAVTVAVREEKPFVGSFRTTHQGTANPIKRKGCKHKSVQEQALSPVVPLHVDFRPTKEATETCEAT